MPLGGPLAQSRRALLIGAGVTCAAALAGCTTYDANNGGWRARRPRKQRGPFGGSAASSASGGALPPAARPRGRARSPPPRKSPKAAARSSTARTS